jgi:tetratricopeptide (TPR) repeat protein
VIMLQAGKQPQAEIECRKARALHEELAADKSSLKFSPECLAKSLDTLGDIARLSGRAAEAKALHDRAIALQEQQDKKNPTKFWSPYYVASSTRRRGLALRDLGDISGAAADARRAMGLCDGLTSRWGPHFFETACCHAALAGLAGRAGSGVSAAEEEREAAKAVEWLGRAVANGYRNTNELRIESALDPLRDRPDFKKLMAELKKNSPQQQEKK